MKLHWLGGIACLFLALGAHAQNLNDTLAKIKASGKLQLNTSSVSRTLSGITMAGITPGMALCETVIRRPSASAETTMPSRCSVAARATSGSINGRT